MMPNGIEPIRYDKSNIAASANIPDSCICDGLFRYAAVFAARRAEIAVIEPLK